MTPPQALPFIFANRASSRLLFCAPSLQSPAANNVPIALIPFRTLADPNPSDNLLFAIIGGNTGGAFKIAACGGQIRVADAILDYDLGPRVYNLTVQVSDDGTPPKSATTVITVRVCVCHAAPGFPLAPLPLPVCCACTRRAGASHPRCWRWPAG
jgi:hypothetical protein